MAIDPRKTIENAAREKGVSLSELSKGLGKNHAYLQQFIKRGVPTRLPEEVRISLSRTLGVSERELGAPASSSRIMGGTESLDLGAGIDHEEPQRISIDEEWQEHEESTREAHKAYSRDNYRPEIPGAIPEINVELGAGEGRVGEVISFPIGSETYSAHQVVEEWLLPESYLSRVIESQSGNTVIMPVVGDSMMPTYNPGDRVIVDMTQDRLMMDTVYAISDGVSPPQIKRLQRVMFAEPPEVIIISDNQSHESQRVPMDRLKILGRIVGVVAKR